MGPNPLIGVVYHWIGGFASATNFIPFRQIKRWSWEVYWIIQGVAAWLIAPIVAASLLVPHLFPLLRQADHATLGWALLWGAVWGVGGLTFGLAIRYLGIALGYAIALGLCMVFGTVVPPIFHGEMGGIVHSRSGLWILAGVLLCLVAVATNGAAGLSKEKEITPEEKVEAGERDFSFVKGILIAVGAGFMSSFFAFGLDAGKPLAAQARASLLSEGRSDIWQNLPVLVVVLWGGFVTNFVWSLVLILRNRSGKQFLGEPGVNPMRGAPLTGDTLMDWDPRKASEFHLTAGTLAGNYFFAALAGVIWYFQFFFYSMGQTKMGQYDFSSWTLHMASIIIFATLWGLVLREWRGTSARTKVLVTAGLVLLVGSTLVVGYGNYIKAHEAGTVTASR